MRKSVSTLTAGIAALALSACGGDSGNGSLTSGGAATGGGGGGGTGGTTTGNGGTQTASPVYSMGNGTGASFQAGMIGISNASVAAGGSTSLTIDIVDQTGTLYTSGSNTNVTLNSPCLASGLAEISVGTTHNLTSIGTMNGTINAVYNAKGCSGSDVITATTTVGAQSLTATGTVTVAAATIGSVQFTSATPTTIGLKGTGLTETSTVVFKVVDSTGGPRPGVQVSFALNTTVGGLSISPTSATSASDGTVQTVVSAGTQHTAVRVTASIAQPALSTQSSVLTVTTGLPASQAFSIAVGAPSYSPTGPACSNVEAWNVDLITVPITTQLADRYGNPAPDGTAVAFTTNGGHIVGNCTTPLTTPGDGACKVTWSSANPRPGTSSTPPTNGNGRATIFATAIGEESFNDVNGNGFYDVGEPFKDLGEPFRDDNEDGAYQLGEYFLDFNQNQMHDGPSGVFKGVTCTGNTPGSTCSSSTLAIGVNHPLIMSTSAATITLISGPSTVTHGTSATYKVNVQDLNGNSMPAGTTVTFSSDSTIGSASGSFSVGCDAGIGGQNYLGTLAAALPSGAASSSGNLVITVKSPLGTVTQALLPVAVN
jgi:hypothetical protein